MKRNIDIEKGKNIAKLSLWSVTILAVIKLTAGFLSGSIGLIADGINSFTDILANLTSYLGLKISEKKANNNFPFGFYKSENIATLIISFFIFFAGYKLFVLSYNKLFSNYVPEITIFTLIIPIISIIYSFTISKHQIKIGKEINSNSLIAKGIDSRNDVFATGIVLFGMFCTYLNVKHIEILAGILVSLFIFRTGYICIKTAIYPLLDGSADKKLINKVKKIIIKEKCKIKYLRIRTSGLFFHGEATILVDSRLSLKKAHDIANNIENRIEKEIREIKDFIIHIEPK
jgi:cation diffusion facilitator family transporter